MTTCLNKSILALCALASFSARSAEQAPASDLVLDGARWLAKSTGYVCDANSAETVQAPSDLAALSVAFETAVTDYSLDNVVILANFSPEESTTCRYSVRLFADNATKAVTFVESRAYASSGAASCEGGKSLLDASFQASRYVWKERGHMLTILVPNASADALCGPGKETIGYQFKLAGKIN